MRRVLFWCHLTVALCAGVVITIMAATGVALAYQRQILAAVAARHAVAPPEAGAKKLPLDSLAQRLASEPTHLEIASITLNSDPTMPLVVGLADRHSIFVDPYTAKVLGNDDAARGFFRAVERWHRSIAIGTGMRSPAGTAVSGASNLAFMFIIVSGFILWWPKKWSRRAFARILKFQPRARGRAREWNWHHVLGFWAAPVLLIIVVSGTFMSYTWPQQLVARAMGVSSATAARGSAREARPRSSSESESLSSQSPASHFPLPASLETGPWTTIQFRLPQGSARTMAVSITEGTANRPDRRVQLTVDATTGAVIGRQGYNDTDPARRVRSWARPIHTGEAFGLVGQTIAALASAAVVLLAITGFTMAFRRLVRSRRSTRLPVDGRHVAAVAFTGAADEKDPIESGELVG